MPKVNQHDRNMDRKRVGLSKVGFGLEEDMSQVDLVMALADAFAEAETSFWMGQENPNYEVFTSARISRNEARDALLAAVTAHADEIEALRADAATAIAIQRAAKELPEFYNISIEIERGYGGVRLSNPNNEITAFEFDEGDAGLADCINEAVNAARAAQGGDEMAVKIGYESGYAEGRASRDVEVEALQARVLESQQHREAMNKELKNLVDERDAVDPRWYKMDFDFVKAKIDALKAERDSALAKLAALEITKDAAYAERNRLVSLLSKVFPSGKKQTAIEGWSEDWHGCVYIDLPTGQASWHYHTEQSWLFAHLPEYQGTWDGHTTNEKYERIQSFAAGAQAQPLSDGEIYTAYIEATNQTLRPQDERLALLFARAIEKAHKIGGSV